MKGRSTGFTLLEMMLTVGLIALTATFVGLNIGQSDAKLAELEAKRFVALLNLAQDESILSGRPIKLSVDLATHSYQFALLEAPAILPVAGNDDASEATPDTPAPADEFYRQRNFPEVVKLEFSLLPQRLDEIEDDGFVPKRVHEILNKSLFDDEYSALLEEDAQELILIEPNGLISPFSLSLSVEERIARVELDRFGRAALVQAQ